MIMQDLLYEDIDVDLDFAGDGVDYFDYTLYTRSENTTCRTTITIVEIEQLRENCKKILEAIKGAINQP